MLKHGFAKSAFFDLYQKTPWNIKKKREKEIFCPILDRLFTQKKINYLDLILTKKLFRSHPDVSQETLLFVCHLILSAKEGHLCVHITENEIHPSVNQLWQNEEGCFLPPDEVYALTQMIITGAHILPEEIVDHFQNLKTPGTSGRPICCEGSRFYLQRNWIFETRFLQSLNLHMSRPLSISLDIQKVQRCIQQLCADKVLLEEQGRAIEAICLNGLTLVTGGPGTGKTYTAGFCIRVFWENLSEEQRKNCQVVLAAPTGKAASNLQRSLNRVTSSLENFPPIQAKTLHSLLGIRNQFSDRESRRLSADLIVVDESSMIDVRMMAALFAGLKPGSRLILLGDRHQLPSVESGSVFADLIQLHHAHSKWNIPCISLSTCLRAELKSLIDFAHLVNQGSSQEVLFHLNRAEIPGIKRLLFSDERKNFQREFLSHVLPYFQLTIQGDDPPEKILDFFHAIRILSPVRKGPFGVDSLNQLIWQKSSQQTSTHGWIAIPIMVTVNDYRQELFNGETGVLMRRLPLHSLNTQDYAIFPGRQEGEKTRRLPACLLPKYELAYCLSVHKSQGSEFDRVILIIPEGSEIFGREVLYTAVTRARKHLEIYGSDAVILKTIEQQGIRLSGIQYRVIPEYSSLLESPSCHMMNPLA